METENGQVDIQYDMIFMLGGLWEACPFFVIKEVSSWKNTKLNGSAMWKSPRTSTLLSHRRMGWTSPTQA